MTQMFANDPSYMQAWLAFADSERPGPPSFAFPETRFGFIRSFGPDSSSGEASMEARLQRAGQVVEQRGIDLIRAYPLVTGVAASLRFQNGEIKGNEPCITFFVSEKLPVTTMGTSGIPSKIDGVATDVVAAGTPVALATTAPTPGVRSSPVDPGSSISHSRISSGTFGCLVEDASTQYLLSCAHVVSDAAAVNGDAILHPGTYYGGVLPADKIAELTKTISLTTGNSIADAGIAKVMEKSKVTPNIKGIGKPTGTRALNSVGVLVQKSGDKTGLTHGVVVGLKGTVGPLQINGVANVYFTDSIITTGMSEPGDSGALLMDYQKKAIGLLFAGLQSGGAYVVSWYSPIDTVLTNLGVSLVT
jgi:hypothetical protein